MNKHWDAVSETEFYTFVASNRLVVLYCRNDFWYYATHIDNKVLAKRRVLPTEVHNWYIVKGV